MSPPLRGLAACVLAVAVAACTQASAPLDRPDVVVGARPASFAAPPLAAPGAAPRIVSVWLSKTEFAPGERVAGRIITTTNVASLEIRVEGYGRVIPRTDFGSFEGAVAVPALPAFLHRAFTLQILARNASGVAAKTTIPIRVL